jgi:hypothetical protein
VAIAFSVTLAALIAFLSAWPIASHAFPENVRHGYVNCTSCHVSPNGTGILTPYGRSLASELQSTWSYPGEENLFHGLIKAEALPEWLVAGGDLRWVQIWRGTETADQAEFIRMQTDVEAAFRFNGVTLDATFGRIEGPSLDRWGSRRYFAMYNITEETTLRVGRFYPSFGILMPDHYASTRRGLGFDANLERDNAEIAWNGETWNIFATLVRDPGETPEDDKETAFALQVNRAFLDRFKIGGSAWYGDSNNVGRQILGVHGILGFTKRFFLVSELDHQWHDARHGNYQRGLFAFNRLGYEAFKGFIVFGQAEYSQPDLSRGATSRDAFGPGIQFFPRPHFEFLGLWQKSRIRQQGSDFDDFAFLLLHYYF